MLWLESLGVWETPARIGMILILAVIARIVLAFSIRKTTRAILEGARSVSKNGKSSKGNGERVAQRGKTISAVLDNFATWTLVITVVVMILSELGVDVGALIAVSTIVGAAVGFGAQTLVKDVISGIFMVFEDQFGVGDDVNLGTVVGKVERVRLRVTEVRDQDGMLWFVRNGEIINVGNGSHGKSL
jgi:small conductance mechanosensitive channel